MQEKMDGSILTLSHKDMKTRHCKIIKLKNPRCQKNWTKGQSKGIYKNNLTCDMKWTKAYGQGFIKCKK